MGMGNASVNNQVKNLKVFLGQPFEQELHEYAHFKRFRKMGAVAPKVVYLTTAEKARLFALSLAHVPYLEQTRDIFLRTRRGCGSPTCWRCAPNMSLRISWCSPPRKQVIC
jgi:hypothetical protein